MLEIGCGWGCFACFAAREYGCTRHRADDLARAGRARARRVAAAGLADRVADPRAGLPRARGQLHEGRLDRDARGDRRAQFGDLLRGDATACSSPAASRACRRSSCPTSASTRYRTTPDWIERYVFPGCLIPSLGALRAAWPRASRLMLAGGRGDRPPLRGDAAPLARSASTRASTRCARSATTSASCGRGTSTSRYCEAAFRTRSLRDVQLVLTRPSTRRCDRAVLAAAAARRGRSRPLLQLGALPRCSGARATRRASTPAGPSRLALLAVALRARSAPGELEHRLLIAITGGARERCASPALVLRRGRERRGRALPRSCARAGASAGASSRASPSSTRRRRSWPPCSRCRSCSRAFNRARGARAARVGRRSRSGSSRSSLEALADRQLAALQGGSGQPRADDARAGCGATRVTRTTSSSG